MKNLFSYIKMGKEILTFGNIEIEKKIISYFFGRCRYWNILLSEKISFGEKNYKYFIGYLYDDHKVKPLHIMLPKTSAYEKKLWWAN